MKILIVDDHEVVRRGVRSLLQSKTGYEVCAEAVDGEDAVQKANELRPDVIIMDISMPNLNGLEATQLIRRQVPESKVLVLTQHESDEMARQAFKAGARGYVVKSSIARDLVGAIEQIQRNEAFVDRSVAQHPQAAPEVLQRSAALEQALHESEERYRALVMASTQVLWRCNAQGEAIWISENWNGETHSPVGQSVGQNRIHLVHPDDRERTLALWQESVRTGAMFSNEFRRMLPDGSWRYLESRGVPIRNSDGTIREWIGSNTDITERKRAEEALRESEERFRSTFEQAAVGMAHLTTEGRWLRINRKMCEILGYTYEELLTKTFQEITHPEDLAEDTAQAESLLAGKIQSYTMEKRYITSRGAIVWGNLTGSLVRDAKGQPNYLIAVVEDITERKNKEKALRESEAQLRLAMQASRTGMFQFDLEKDRGIWSPELDAIYGFSPDAKEISGDTWKRLFHPDDLGKILQDTEKFLREGDSFEYEFRIVRPDGEVRWIVSRGKIIRDQAGKPIQMTGVNADVTERKQSDEARLQSERDLKSAVELLRIAQETAQAATWDWDIESSEVRWGEGSAPLFGIPAEQLRNIEEIRARLHPEDRDSAFAGIEPGTEPAHEGQFRVVWPDGSIHWLLDRGRIFFDHATGQPARMLGLCMDVTSRKEAELALEQREAHLRMAQSVSGISTWGWESEKGRAVEWSKEAYDLFGLNAAQPPDIDLWLSRVHEDDRVEVLRRIEECVSSGTLELEYRYRHPQRGVIWVQAMGRTFGAAGAAQRMFGVMQDVTARKQAELETQRHRGELQNAVDQRTEELRQLSNRLMQMQDEERRHIARELHDSAGQIVAALSMNLVPLEQILERVAEGEAGEPEAKKGIRQGLESVRDSLGLVNQLSQELRTISHLLHPPLLDEAGLHSALEWYVEGFAERSKIAVDLKLSRDLGRLSPEMETAVFRIVQEALTNVHRHSGSRTASIDISWENGSVRLKIADTGRGLTTDAGRRRTGVGIQGMKERARKLGGELEVESGEQGTVITAVIPAPGQTQPAASA